MFRERFRPRLSVTRHAREDESSAAAPTCYLVTSSPLKRMPRWLPRAAQRFRACSDEVAREYGNEGAPSSRATRGAFESR